MHDMQLSAKRTNMHKIYEWFIR